MTTKLVSAIAFWGLATTCIIASGYVMFAMIGEINRRFREVREGFTPANIPGKSRIMIIITHFRKAKAKPTASELGNFVSTSELCTS